MPKSPPDLARLLQSSSATDRVQVQQTDLAYDVLGRYVCNDWAEIEAQQQDGGYPFDVVVIGAGMFGGYCAEKLYRHGVDLNLRILVLEASVDTSKPAIRGRGKTGHRAGAQAERVVA